MYIIIIKDRHPLPVEVRSDSFRCLYAQVIIGYAIEGVVFITVHLSTSVLLSAAVYFTLSAPSVKIARSSTVEATWRPNTHVNIRRVRPGYNN